MPRHRWTDEDDHQIRRRINLEQTYDEIGAALGVSRNAVAARVQRLGLGSPERAAFLRSRRLKGKKRPKDVMRRVAKASKARAEDPAHRARLQEMGQRHAANPKRIRAVAKALDRKRGGPILPELAEDYRLARRKHLPAAEAYAATHPTIQTFGKGA
ncbi:hypothetical protein D3218_12960 [Aureimonas flava]|uniref:Uncharacterized protein n=1 Tax=Aureimonas flava TaxID=2320271 RepID=A0A3A1WJS3_9HYPH|nr:GcrA family cell cycle regulator [Aureimonas flava]RIY00192.1 hypothetical protein D3218_12960 [Aureimonas flava]